MYRFYLNSTEIKEPSGFSSLLFNKSITPEYNGFIEGEYGYIEVGGGLIFSDAISKDIIKSEISDVKGRIDFEITFCEVTKFSGLLDLSSITRINESYTANIVQDTGQNTFISKHRIKYGIQPNRKITLPKKEYYTGGSYEIGTNREYNANTVGGIALNIAVPLNVIIEKETSSNNSVKTDVIIEGMQNSQMTVSNEIVAPIEITRQNITVVGLTEGSIVNHILNSNKITVRFFDTDGRDARNIDWEVITNNSIKVYLPISDGGGASTFTGDIFITKRLTQ